MRGSLSACGTAFDGCDAWLDEEGWGGGGAFKRVSCGGREGGGRFGVFGSLVGGMYGSVVVMFGVAFGVVMAFIPPQLFSLISQSDAALSLPL